MTANETQITMRGVLDLHEDVVSDYPDRMYVFGEHAFRKHTRRTYFKAFWTGAAVTWAGFMAAYLISRLEWF